MSGVGTHLRTLTQLNQSSGAGSGAGAKRRAGADGGGEGGKRAKQASSNGVQVAPDMNPMLGQLATHNLLNRNLPSLASIGGGGGGGGDAGARRTALPSVEHFSDLSAEYGGRDSVVTSSGVGPVIRGGHGQVRSPLQPLPPPERAVSPGRAAEGLKESLDVFGQLLQANGSNGSNGRADSHGAPVTAR